LQNATQNFEVSKNIVNFLRIFVD